jgi:hypothetical protein
MTWGSEWGFLWGGDLLAYDFQSLFDSKMWKQLDYAENLRKLFNVAVVGLSDADDTAVTLSEAIGIDRALGADLDDWGARVGIARNGMQDDIYRRAIKATARKAFGQGDVQTFYDIMRVFTGASNNLTLVESFPANILLWFHNLTIDEQRQIGALYRGVEGLGIGLHMAVVDPAGVFQWAGDNWTPTRGFAGDNASSSDSAGFAGGVVT